jgi:hypothetical protein
MIDHGRYANPGDLMVTLLCDNKVVETQLAASPQEAALTAVTMIWHIGELDAGDSIAVTDADPGANATLVPAMPG